MSEQVGSQGTNIPAHAFARIIGHSLPFPALGILWRAFSRVMARQLYPTVLVVELSGPTAWTSMCALSSAVVVGVPMSWVLDFSALLSLVLGAFLAGWFLLSTGQVQNSAASHGRLPLTLAPLRGVLGALLFSDSALQLHQNCCWAARMAAAAVVKPGVPILHLPPTVQATRGRHTATLTGRGGYT